MVCDLTDVTASERGVMANSLKDGTMRLSPRSLVGTMAVSSAILLAGCCNFGGNTTTTQKALADVVDAVQFAIDEAANDTAWSATEAELKHWSAACEDVRTKAASSC